jgi:hypothetical protein
LGGILEVAVVMFDSAWAVSLYILQLNIEQANFCRFLTGKVRSSDFKLTIFAEA